MEAGVTQDQTRENLLKLHDCVEEFTLVFSGRKNRRVLGFYRWGEKEITIHDRNFENNEAGDNLLFYTAIHELAHHIQFTEHGQTGNRCHTKLFYSICDGLAEKAEKLGLYRYDAEPEVKKLIDEAAAISAEIAALQRKLGETLNKLQGACHRKGIRYEDIVKRKVKLSARMERKLQKIAVTQVPEGTGFEMQEAIAAAKSEEQREAVLRAAEEGKSVAQAKQAGAGSKAEPDELGTLVREEKRINNTIAALQRRLSDIIKRIEKLKGGGG
jgi:hypothetical protein